MKVIFIDNDGVICLERNWGSRLTKQKKFYKGQNRPPMNDVDISVRFDDLDKNAVKVLNQILEETEAELVISSDWKKYATLEELGDYYELHGIIKRPIGVTDRFHYTNWSNEGLIPDHNNFDWSRMFALEQERFFEIQKWLNEHPEVTHYVVLDDLDMRKYIDESDGELYDRGWGFKNFIWVTDIDGIAENSLKDNILKFLKDE